MRDPSARSPLSEPGRYWTQFTALACVFYLIQIILSGRHRRAGQTLHSYMLATGSVIHVVALAIVPLTLGTRAALRRERFGLVAFFVAIAAVGFGTTLFLQPA